MTIEEIEKEWWTVKNTVLDGKDIAELYRAIPDYGKMCMAIGVKAMSSRRFNRSIQILKRAGLVRYNRHKSSWERIEKEGELR